MESTDRILPAFQSTGSVPQPGREANLGLTALNGSGLVFKSQCARSIEHPFPLRPLVVGGKVITPTTERGKEEGRGGQRLPCWAPRRKGGRVHHHQHQKQGRGCGICRHRCNCRSGRRTGGVCVHEHASTRPAAEPMAECGQSTCRVAAGWTIVARDMAQTRQSTCSKRRRGNTN